MTNIKYLSDRQEAREEGTVGGWQRSKVGLGVWNLGAEADRIPNYRVPGLGFRKCATDSAIVSNSDLKIGLLYCDRNLMKVVQVSDTHIPEQKPHMIGHYVADHIPADWALAEAHAQAVKPGKHIPHKNEACPCCMGYVEKEPVGYCENTKELAFLGEGFPLFYNFLKFCIVMLAALILDDAIIAVLISIDENQCSQVHRLLNTSEQANCQNNFANDTAYISDTESVGRTAIKFTGYIAQLLLLMYFRDQQNKLAEYIDQRNCTMSDYTLELENIPTGEDKNAQKTRLLITDNNPDLLVADVLIIEHGKEYADLEKQLASIVARLQKAIKSNASEEVVDQLQKSYQDQHERIEEFGKTMEKNEKTYFHGQAFIVMNTEEQKEKALELLNSLTVDQVQKQYPSYSGQPKLNAKEANEPKQIIWENIHCSRTQRICSIFVGWLVTIVFMTAVTVAFFFLIQFKGHLIEEAHLHYTEDPAYATEFNQGMALGYIIVILINLINKFVFSPIFHAITHHEKHLSVSSSNLSYALKYTLCMFFTTALMTLLVEAIIYSNYTGALGVIEEEHFMFIFNAYFSPLVFVVNPYNFFAWVKRKIYYGNHYYTQHEANKLMEMPEYSMGKRYAEIIKTIWFTFLYVELIPFGAIYSFTGIILYYFTDKYVLTYNTCVKDSVSSDLSRTMVTVLEFTLVLKPAGELIFDSKLRSHLPIDSLVMLCIGVVYMLLPMNAILNWINHENFQPEQKTFEEAKDSFPETYFTLYPIHRHEVANRYLRKDKISLMNQTRSPLRRAYSLVNSISELQIPASSGHELTALKK